MANPWFPELLLIFYDLLDLSTMAYGFSNAVNATFVYVVFIKSRHTACTFYSEK